MCIDAHVWWCYASVRQAFPEDHASWRAVVVELPAEEIWSVFSDLEDEPAKQRMGIYDGLITVRCFEKPGFRLPMWMVSSGDEDRYALSLGDLGRVMREMRQDHGGRCREHP